MAKVDDAKQALAKRTEENTTTLAKLIASMKPEIARALPAHMNPDRMARIATTLLRQTPRLADVTPQSFLGALMTCSQLGLEPGPLGFAWIIPREVRDQGRPTGVWEANFQLGYKGAIELARRSGKLAKITARTVYSNEVRHDWFTVEYDGADERIVHKPIVIGERGEPVLYYAIAKLTNGEQVWAPLTPREVDERHRKRSSAQDSPAWRNDYQAMAWKSCVVELRRWLPQSPELEQALAQDGRVRTDVAPEVLETPPADPNIIDSTAEDLPTADEAAPVESEPTDQAEPGGWPKTRKPPSAPPPIVDGDAT